MAERTTAPLLTVRGLSIAFPTEVDPDPAPVVRDVSFDVARGEFAAVVGESGCGKSLTAMSLTRLPPTDRALVRGSIRFDGRELLGLPPRALRDVRGRGIAYVFQDPAGSLNPVLRIRAQLAEALPPGVPRDEADRRLRALLETVRVPEPERVLRAYPHELSGGLQQRVGVAMAAAADPLLLVADEPTTALDATTQKSVLELLDRLRRERGIALLLITHNLGLVARHADNVHVMYAGEVVESGPVADVLRAPAHPYTRGLFGAVPSLDLRGLDDLRGIPGRVPQPAERGEGCAFAPRCPDAEAACAEPAARTLHPVSGPSVCDPGVEASIGHPCHLCYPCEPTAPSAGAALPRLVRCRRAFTLLETLAVIFVLAVLAGIVVAQARLAKVRGDEARARAELGQIRNALEQYRATFDGYPPSIVEEGDKPTDEAVALTNIHAWTHAPAWCLLDDADERMCLRNFLPGAEKQEGAVKGFTGLDPWNHPYWYYHDPEEAPDTYLLFSCGPDWRPTEKPTKTLLYE